MDQNTIWLIVFIGLVLLVLFFMAIPTKTQKGPVSDREDKMELMNNGEVVLAQVQEVKPKTQNGSDYFVTACWRHPQSKKIYTVITFPEFPNYPFPKALKPFEIGSYVIVYYNRKDPTNYYVKEFKSPPLIIGDITLNSKGGVRTLEDVLGLVQRGIRTEAYEAVVQTQTKNGKTYYYLSAFWEDPSTNKIRDITSGAFPSSPPIRKNNKIIITIDPSNTARYFVNLYLQQ